MKSVRTKRFKELLLSLPANVQRQAQKAYRLFRQNPFYPSFHRRIVEITRNWKYPHWEFRITRVYRATCFIDGDTYVWVFIGHHSDFNRLYT